MSGSRRQTHQKLSQEHDSADSRCRADKRALPPWRYKLRQRMLPLVRWETPYLARLQSAMRSPVLDRYFAITANLGTHTFFMIGIPMLFWCGFPSWGKR